jgi:hypothetical protein
VRTIISLTTIPSRLATLEPTIDSLLCQGVKADEIRLHVTPSCEGKTIKLPITCVHVAKDWGPVTKLYAATDSRFAPDDLIITVDDDIYYKPNWLATILEAANRWPDNAIGFSGWNVGGFLEGTGSYQFASAPCFVDVVEGWSGAAYRKRFFDGVDILNSPPAFQFVDDVWISSRLHKHGIKRRLVAFPMEKPIDSNAPGLHKRLDFVELNRHAVREGWK